MMAWIKTDSLASFDGIVTLGYAWRMYGSSNGNIRFQCADTIPAQSMAVGSTDLMSMERKTLWIDATLLKEFFVVVLCT